MKKIYTQALAILAALTTVTTTTSCDDTFEVVDTGERIEDIVEINCHDVEVDWAWNDGNQSKTVGEIESDRNDYYIKADCPYWLVVKVKRPNAYQYESPSNIDNYFYKRFSGDYILMLFCTDGGNSSENPREGVVTITVANALDKFVEVEGGGTVEIPYQEITKSFTVRQTGLPIPEG